MKLCTNFLETIWESFDECDHGYEASKSASLLIQEVVVHFQNKLKENKYHGYLFDRSKVHGKFGPDMNEKTRAAKQNLVVVFVLFC